MTKELVKSENGHKIMKHARQDSTYSRFSVPRIKMGFATPCLVILILAVAVNGKSTTLSEGPTSTTPEATANENTEDGQLKTSESTDTTAVATNVPSSPGKNDDNDIAAGGDLTLDEILLFGNLFGGDDASDENSQTKPKDNTKKETVKSEDIDTDSTNPLDSKVSPDTEGIRRQGDVNPTVRQKNINTDIQYDEPKQDERNDSPPRFGERYKMTRKERFQDDPLDLQLTEGGYNKPFPEQGRKRSKNRYVSLPDSSEQSEKVLEIPSRSSNRQQESRQLLPQVAYSAPQIPFNTFGPGPIMRRTVNAPVRNVLAINHAIPADAQNGFLNTPPTGYADFPGNGFQGQFPGPDSGVFPAFVRDPNNAALYQTSQRNPFQDPRLLFQSGPQAQSILIDPTGNIQDQFTAGSPQFQPNAFSAFPGFDNDDDNSRSNYGTYFRSPGVNPPFQVPPNFFVPNPNRANTFSNPPVNFLTNVPNNDGRLPTQFFRYPTTTDAQNRQNANDQQPESDASGEDKKTSEPQEDTKLNNNESPKPFGARLSDEADVYIRYPTNEAGYAVEENLPRQNITDETKDSNQETVIEERNFPNGDPYRNALNSLGASQRRNNSYEFPPPLFRDVPINFGYQRPQTQILVQYPDRNRDLPSFRSPDFNSGSPFDIITENNYPFLNPNNQRRVNPEPNVTPTCAKQNNASICFEDNDYPRNDILYSLNSNSFLVDRLSGPDVPLEKVALVEQNSSLPDQKTENYACTVDTRYGSPMRAKNVAGAWRVIVSVQGRFWQPVRLEVCKSFGDPCKYADSKIKTTCVQKYSMHRLLSWSPDRGIYTDIYKFPVACSCQILDSAER